jgi:hypothetical protein
MSTVNEESEVHYTSDVSGDESTGDSNSKQSTKKGKRKVADGDKKRKGKKPKRARNGDMASSPKKSSNKKEPPAGEEESEEVADAEEEESPEAENKTDQVVIVSESNNACAEASPSADPAPVKSAAAARWDAAVTQEAKEEERARCGYPNDDKDRLFDSSRFPSDSGANYFVEQIARRYHYKTWLDIQSEVSAGNIHYRQEDPQRPTQAASNQGGGQDTRGPKKYITLAPGSKKRIYFMTPLMLLTSAECRLPEPLYVGMGANSKRFVANTCPVSSPQVAGPIDAEFRDTWRTRNPQLMDMMENIIDPITDGMGHYLATQPNEFVTVRNSVLRRKPDAMAADIFEEAVMQNMVRKCTFYPQKENEFRQKVQTCDLRFFEMSTRLFFDAKINDKTKQLEEPSDVIKNDEMLRTMYYQQRKEFNDTPIVAMVNTTDPSTGKIKSKMITTPVRRFLQPSDGMEKSLDKGDVVSAYGYLTWNDLPGGIGCGGKLVFVPTKFFRLGHKIIREFSEGNNEDMDMDFGLEFEMPSDPLALLELERRSTEIDFKGGGVVSTPMVTHEE